MMGTAMAPPPLIGQGEDVVGFGEPANEVILIDAENGDARLRELPLGQPG
jgi:hypothetical protein